MSYVSKERKPPMPWREFRKHAPSKALIMLYAVNWAVDWAAYRLGSWSVVELLEYLGSFSILFAAIVYFLGASDRLKQKHYQAWQVINTAEGKGGSGGRIDALQELNSDRVSLIGVNVAGAYLQGLRLEQAQARRANFAGADLRDADLKDASLSDADIRDANLRRANLKHCNLADAHIDNADLTEADISQSDLGGTTLDGADLHNANLDQMRNWQAIKSLDKANIFGVRNAPPGFVEWAKKRGAVQVKSD